MIYESLEIVELGHAEDLIEFGPFGDIDNPVPRESYCQSCHRARNNNR
jgi:hypothetical protein